MSTNNPHTFYVWLLLLAAIWSCCCGHTAAASFTSAEGISRHIRALKDSDVTAESACPAGCEVQSGSNCPNGGCVVKKLSGNTTVCCTNDFAQRFAYELAAAGTCDSVATSAIVIYTQRAMEGVNAAFWRSGSIMNIVNITATCLKATTTFAVPTSFKVCWGLPSASVAKQLMHPLLV